MLIALHAGLLEAWVPTAIAYGDHTLVEIQAHSAVNRVWTMPPKVMDRSGLGGGLSYAWDPQLCGLLLPRFSEDITGLGFVTCDSLRAAFQRALHTWSAHHPLIAFHDVTNECAAAHDWSGGVVGGEGCSLAELWVTAKTNSTGTDTAATAVSAYEWSEEFVHTNGVAAGAGVHQTIGTVVGFNYEPPMCWYLDSLFCSRFHTLKARFGSQSVFVFGQALLWAVWALALLSVLHIGSRICRRHLELYRESIVDANDDGRVDAAELQRWLKRKAKVIRPGVPTTLHSLFATYGAPDESRPSDDGLGSLTLEQFARLEKDLVDEDRFDRASALAAKTAEQVARLPVLWTALRLTLLWAPPLFYVKIFLPCWDCYDFEAAAAHEIGHALARARTSFKPPTGK